MSLGKGIVSQTMTNGLRSLILLLIVAVGLNAQSYHYKVKYGPVSAGSARIDQKIEGNVLSSEMRMTSSPWLSNLWTLSDSIISSFDLANNRLIDHYKAIHEGKYHRTYQVDFTDSTAIINGESNEHDPTEVFDVPSLLHHLTTETFTKNDTLEYSLWDGKGYGQLTLKVEKIGKPTLRKPFQTSGWKLIPLTSTKKSRENEIRLTILMSRKSPRVPLRIHIDTKYGEVVMKLEE